MRSSFWVSFGLAFCSLLNPSGRVWGASVQEVTEEKLFTLRSLGELEISNLRGHVEVHSWGLEKIKVRYRKWVKYPDETPDEISKKRLKEIEIKGVEKGSNFRVFADFTKGLSLPERYREREGSTSGVDMVVFAPAQIKVNILVQKGNVQLNEWRANISVRAEEGKILISDVSAKKVSVYCPKCPVVLKSIRADVRVLGGEGLVDLDSINGSDHFFDAFSGGIVGKNVIGQSLMVSKSGNIEIKNFQGGMSFQSEGGNVSFLDGKGRVTGSTREGNVFVRVFDWLSGEPSFIESVSGSITMMAPEDFSGEVELRSPGGKIQNDFTLKNPKSAAGVQKGIIRGASGFLRLESQDGDIRLLKIGSPQI